MEETGKGRNQIKEAGQDKEEVYAIRERARSCVLEGCKGRVSQDHLAKQRIIKESDNCSAGCFCCTQRVYQVL